jgi:hypothetical protein
MRSECDRTRLIAELSGLLSDCELPEDARRAGLTLIGFLARRMPGECASTVGVSEVRRQAQRCAMLEPISGVFDNTLFANEHDVDDDDDEAVELVVRRDSRAGR